MIEDPYMASKMEDDIFLSQPQNPPPTWITSQDNVRRKQLRKIKTQIRRKATLIWWWMKITNQHKHELKQLQEEAAALEATLTPVQIIEPAGQGQRGRPMKIGDTVITKDLADKLKNSDELQELIKKFL